MRSMPAPGSSIFAGMLAMFVLLAPLLMSGVAVGPTQGPLPPGTGTPAVQASPGAGMPGPDFHPMPDVPPTEDHVQMLVERDVQRSTGLVYVLVEPGIYPEVSGSIDRYLGDMMADGYLPELHTEGWADCGQVKALLQEGWSKGMVGAVLVGDVPWATYEIDDDFSEYGYTDFPIDLYYMDLDGDWLDADHDGKYDNHTSGTGDIEADIWVGRILSSTVTLPGRNETCLINDYFMKNHEYRMGNLSVYDRALLEIDDDWAYWSRTHYNELALLYDNITLVDDPELTVADDYMERITVHHAASVFSVENETVYGPALGGETGPFFLARGGIVNCTLYAEWGEQEGPGFGMLEEPADYVLNRSTGEIDTSPMGPLAPGMVLFAWYNWSAQELMDDSPYPVVNESVYGPALGGEPGPIYLANGNIFDLDLYLDTGDEWAYLEEGLEYYLEPVSGEIDISPIAPMEPGWRFYANYNYSRTLGGYYDWVSLFAHSAWYVHSFYHGNHTQTDTLMNTEISSSETAAHFYNLFCCSAGDYSEGGNYGCLASHYLFGGEHTVAVVASSKTGSMLNFGDFYYPLGQGASLGDAFLTWFQLNAESGAGSQFLSRCWFYGMTLLGDPTLDAHDTAPPEPPLNISLEISGLDTVLAWEPSPSPDIHHYEVFVSLTPDGLDPTDPTEVIPARPWQERYSYTDKEAAVAGRTRYYMVKAVDYAMNRDDSQAVSMLFWKDLGNASATWCLASLPLVTPGNNITGVLANSDYEIVRYWNGGWQVYSPGRPDRFNDLWHLDNTMGMWVLGPGGHLAVTGTAPGVSQIPLHAGWNLVGYPSLNSSVMLGLALWGTSADRVLVCDPREPYLLAEVSPSYLMQPGEGYWIHVPVDTIWTVNP